MTEPACPKTSDIEQYIDRIYRLELKLKQSQTEHENEREYHKEEIDEHLKTIESLEKSKHDLYCQMKQLNSQYEESQADLMDKGAEIEKLKADLEAERKMHVKLNGISIEPPPNTKELEIYKTANEELRGKLKHLETMVMSQTVQLNEKEAKLKEYEERVQNLQENLETRISSIAELNEKLKAQEEMYSESLNSALHSNVRDIDDHGRGNSLFSEVESRRVKVEEELNRLRERIKSLTEENAKLQLKLGRGDHKSGVILTQLQAIQKSQDSILIEISKWQADKIRIVERMAQRIEKLREEYQTKLQKISSNINPSDLKLAEERDQLLIQNISLNREILLLKRDLKIQNHLKMEADAGQIIKTVRSEKENNAAQANISQNDIMGTTDPVEGCKQQ